MPEPTSPAGENSPAIYSVFCGIVGIPTALLVGLGGLFGIAGIVLGRIALQRADAGEGRRTTAIVGLALSTLAVLVAIFILAGVA